MSQPPPVQNQDAIWEYFQNDAPQAFEGSKARLQHLVSRMKKENARVLDIGVGTGIFEQFAVDKGFEVYCLDPSEHSINAIRQRFNLGERAQVGYGEELPFVDDYFDYIVLSEVLEHLSNEVIAGTLSECSRVLKADGRVIGTVPARENLQEQIVVCPDCKKSFHRWGHQQRFDAQSMTALLARYLDPVDVHERPYIPFNIMNWKGKLAGAFKLFMWKLGVHGSGENVYFEAQRKPTTH